MKVLRGFQIAVLSAAALGLRTHAQQPNNEEFARRQYESGMAFMQNQRYGDALKDLQAVVDSFGATPVADNALLQIAQYHLEVARDIAATQTAIDKLLKDYPDSDAAPMGHVISGRLALTKGRTPADVDTALASFERVSRLFPGSEAVGAAGYYAGDTLRIVRRVDEALGRFRKVRTEFPRSPWAARAALASGYCLLLQDRAQHALQEIQWVRQQFPGTPMAADALNLNTILYRLYVRAPVQPPYAFSGRTIGTDRSDYRDVVGLLMQPDGRLLLGHKGGAAIFDAKGAAAGAVSSSEPSAFFIDEKNRVVFARNGSLMADRAESVSISVPEKDGKMRIVEEIPAVVVTATGERLVADSKGHEVLRVAPDGKYIGSFAKVDATRIAINAFGDVAMLERRSKTIFLSDRDRKVAGKILPRGASYELDEPVDIAYDAFDHLFVLDRARGSVLVFGPKNRLVASLTIPDKSPGAFTRAAALSLDAAGRLFIFDERAKRIQVYQ